MTKNFQKFIVVIMSFVFFATTVGCGEKANGNSKSNDKYDNWADTKATNNNLNMAEVKKAIDDAKDPSDLEERINKIYEGDGVVVIKVESTPDGRKKISGWEDLNQDGVEDEELFSAIMGEKDVELQGHGSNSYYHESYHFSPPVVIGSPFWWTVPLYIGYHTPMTRVSVITRTRTVYRNSPIYKDQRSKNASYVSQAKKQYGNNFDKAQKEAASKQRNLSKAMNSDFVRRDPKQIVGSGAFGQKKDGALTTSTPASTTQPSLQVGNAASNGLQNPKKLNDAMKSDFVKRDTTQPIGSGAFGKQKPEITSTVQPVKRERPVYQPPPPANDSFFNRATTTSSRKSGGGFGSSRSSGKRGR